MIFCTTGSSPLVPDTRLSMLNCDQPVSNQRLSSPVLKQMEDPREPGRYTAVRDIIAKYNATYD